VQHSRARLCVFDDVDRGRQPRTQPPPPSPPRAPHSLGKRLQMIMLSLRIFCVSFPAAARRIRRRRKRRKGAKDNRRHHHHHREEEEGEQRRESTLETCSSTMLKETAAPAAAAAQGLLVIPLDKRKIEWRRRMIVGSACLFNIGIIYCHCH